MPAVLPPGRPRGGGIAAVGGLLLAEAERQLDDSAGHTRWVSEVGFLIFI